MIRPVATVDVSPKLPRGLERLLDLAYNLRWSWHHETNALFRRLDSDLWVKTNYNPVWLLGQLDQQTLEDAANDTAFMANFKRVCDDFDAYIDAEDTWYRRKFGAADKPFIAYFSMEFGLTTCLQNYSGGLGVLAGDHLKSASDLGLPLVGVGVLYQEGYFQQYLNQDGYQQESYPLNDFANLPVRPVLEEDGKQMVITVPIADQTLHALVWKVEVGRVNLFLMDANHPANPPELYNLTDRLYGGDRRTRIRQEILLGIGGIRMLNALGMPPEVVHLNEGHSALSALERVRLFMKDHPDLDFEDAVTILSTSSVYTIHTPVPAGLERFGYDLIDEHMPWLWQELGLSRSEFHELGREPMGGYDLFSLPVMALKMSSATNGVSQLHGEVSRNMWQWMFPEVPNPEVPVDAVTNGIHMMTWTSGEMEQLLDRYLDPAWKTDVSNSALWQGVERIPDTELWRVHDRRRARLVAFARDRLRSQLIQRNASPTEIEGAEDVLNPEALTIGFARRFATYKRATLLFRDPERLKRIVNDPERPIQFIFAGKAHPHDHPGKELIREVVRFASMPEFRHAFVFLENYDMTVAHYLVQGADIWLNTPRRPQEASGTSGMKVIYNGGLNLSILDGWWAEAYSSDVGWAIGSGEMYDADEYELQDFVESQALYNLLESDVIPLFYERGRDDIPRRWVQRVKNSMVTLAPFFNTFRMVQDYTERFYMSSREQYQHLVGENIQKGKSFGRWLSRVRAAWKDVRVEKVQVSDSNLIIGDSLKVEAFVQLGELIPGDVQVQLFSGQLDTSGRLISGDAIEMKSDGKQGRLYKFSAVVTYDTSGARGVSVRVLPRHESLSDPILTGLMRWADPNALVE